MTHGWRHYDEDAGVAAIFNDKPFSYHRGYRSLSETNHVGDETSIMPNHGLIALDDSVTLIAEVTEAIACWVKLEVVLNHIAKGVDKHLHIKFVWSRRFLVVKMS